MSRGVMGKQAVVVQAGEVGWDLRSVYMFAVDSFQEIACHYEDEVSDG